MILRSIVVLAISGVCLPLNAQLRTRDRFAITNQQVAAKLIAVFAKKGVVLDASQVALPVAVTATERTPIFEIRSIERLGRLRNTADDPTSSAVKLSCTNGACLPFYAVITWSGDEQNSLGLKETKIAVPGIPASDKTVIKSGAHITLFMQSGTTHIQMPVISMENGAPNHQIKVRSVDHKQVYSAEVIDGNTVKGTF